MNAVLLDRAGIERLVPHRGAMCLLERLSQVDEATIVCAATSHRDPANPLRSASGLLAPCAIEYAAQAMALHGALVARDEGAPPTPGYLASVRRVRLHRLRLDDLDGELRVEARREAGNAQQILYAFTVSHRGAPLVDGRATVVLDIPVGSIRACS